MRNKFKQNNSIKFFLRMLVKGIVGAKKHDETILELLANLPKVFIIKIEVLGEGNYITIVKNNNLFYCLDKGEYTKQENLVIEFKNRKSLERVAFGKIGLMNCFANKNIVVYGDLSHAVILTNIVNRVEYYLFPRFMTKKYLPKMEVKLSRTLLFLFIMFHKMERSIDYKNVENIK